MTLIIFTPFVEETRHIEDRWSGIPTIAFRKQDLTRFFEGLSYTEEHLESQTEFGAEHVFYLEKIGAQRDATPANHDLKPADQPVTTL